MSLLDVMGDRLADLIMPSPDHVVVLVAEKDGSFSAAAGWLRYVGSATLFALERRCPIPG